MATLNFTETESLNRSRLRAMLGGPGPCVTVLLPPFKPGDATKAPAAILKSAIQETEKRLAEFLPAASVATLVGPLEEAAQDPELAGGSRFTRAIFRSPGVFEQMHMQLLKPVEAGTFVSGSFAVRPVMDELFRPAEFLLLNLAKDAVALFRCRNGAVERVRLPRGVPDRLADALALEPPDHDLENRSPVGSSTGAMGSVRFGTGSEREAKHAHLADFYKLVDRGLKEIGGEQPPPLILAGVEEDTAIFRRVSNYRVLMPEGIPGGAHLDGSPTEETVVRAHSILDAATAARHAAELEQAKERPAAHFSTDPDFLLNAAFEGRISKLYINADARRAGVYERSNYGSWGEEDLFNLTALRTILYGGEACELPSAKMPTEPSGERAAVVGILRY